MEVVNTIGRRKKAVARIYVNEGKGNITINKREFKEYFTTNTLQYIVVQPLNIVEAVEKYDIRLISMVGE
jgi:small subunit ribosomal protein S9